MNDKKKCAINIVIIIFGLVLLVMPVIRHNQIYISVVESPDMVNAFVPAIEQVINGVLFYELWNQSAYAGFAITMWFLGSIVKMTGIQPETLYMFYSLIVLAFAFYTLFQFGKYIGGSRTGWLVAVFTTLCNTSILALFSYGIVFNIINVYIVFLWALMFYLKWLKSYKWYWLLSSLTLLVAFGWLHPTGIYLALVLTISGGAYFIKRIWRYRRFEWRYVVMVFALLLVVKYCPLARLDVLSWNIQTLEGYVDYLIDFLHFTLQPLFTLVCLIVLAGFIKYRKAVSFNLDSRVVLGILGGLVIGLLVAVLLKVSIYTDRLMIDIGALTSVIVAIVLGRLIEIKDADWLKVSTYPVMALGSLVTLYSWVV